MDDESTSNPRNSSTPLLFPLPLEAPDDETSQVGSARLPYIPGYEAPQSPGSHPGKPDSLLPSNPLNGICKCCKDLWG